MTKALALRVHQELTQRRNQELVMAVDHVNGRRGNPVIHVVAKFQI